MSSTNNQEILLIDPSQIGKTAAADTAIDALDKAAAAQLSLTATNGSTPYTIPYDAGDEPAGVKTALRFIFMLVSGALTVNWTAYMPAGPTKLFFVQNATTGGHDVIIKVLGQTGVTVGAGETKMCYLNGTDVIEIPIAAASANQPWEVGNFINGQPTAGQVVMRFILARTVTWPANFTNNQMKAGTAAAGSAQFKFNINGVQKGTATFSGGGTVATWASTGGLAITGVAGDLCTFVAPNPADGTLADLDWIFSGTR